MTKMKKRWIALAAVLGLGATAVAFAAYGGDCGHGPGPRHYPMATAMALDVVPGRFDPQRLADALKLEPAQQAAWQAYAATLKRGPGAAASAADGAAKATDTAPQRLEASLNLAAQRQQQARERLEAMKSLYAQLSPEQRKTFDRAGHGHGFGPRHAFAESNRPSPDAQATH